MDIANNTGLVVKLWISPPIGENHIVFLEPGKLLKVEEVTVLHIDGIYKEVKGANQEEEE